MSVIRDKVDYFLINFSYSLKIKSIIFVSAATAIFIAIMLIVTQQRLQTSTHKQELGILYQEQLNSLLSSILLHQIYIENGDKSKAAPLTEEIVFKLKAINNLNEGEVHYLISRSQREDLEYNFESLVNEWNEVRKNNDSNVAHMKVVDSVRRLSDVANQSFDLSVNIDTGSRYILYNIRKRLPEIEILSAQIALHSLNEDPTLEEQAQFINLKDTLREQLSNLEQDLTFAQNQNKILSENLSDPVNQNQILDYLQSSSDFLKLFSISMLSKDQAFEAAIKNIRITNALDTLLTQQAKTLLDLQSYTLLIRENYGVGFIIFGVVVVLAAYMTRIIRRPLAGIRHAAEELSKGKMGVRIEVLANDEVGQICDSFNKLVERIERIIHDADAISGQLATSSKGIFTTAKQLESNIIKQEQAITQIASNAKGVSRTVQDFARSLQEVNQSATLTAHMASLGQESLSEMENIMHQMAKASMSIVKTLSDLQDKIGKINSVISTIVRIADQINLLSLNTAIRAGKPGVEHLGFSVVADKISELADQTALATLDIEEMVETIITMVSRSVSVVDSFSDQIRNQVFESTEIGDELKKLIHNTREQFEVFETVNESMQDQTTRAQQIHESINLLTEAAQNTTQSVRNLYLEIEYLHHSTNNLRMMTKKLTDESYEELVPQTS